MEKAEILYQQGRYKEAEKICSGLIIQESSNIHLLAIYSDILRELGKLKEAEEMINTAIGLAPHVDVLHFNKGILFLKMDKYDEAEDSIQRAININPEKSTYFSMWAMIKLERKQFEKALELADKSLELDPEDIIGLNSRSSALLKLDKKDESVKTIEGALQEDPNNAFTHANYGWNMLEKGDHKKALVHFSEAMKLDPSISLARAGMIEALKARYIFYRFFLKYAFWMGNLSGGKQWAVIIGFYVLYRVLGRVAETNELLQVLINPLLILMALFAFSSWIIAPVSNLFLRLNKYGKHLLSKKEMMSSNFVGGSAALSLIGLILYLVTADLKWAPVAVFGLTMMIPLSHLFSISKNKYLAWGYTGVLFLLGAFAIFITFETDIIFNKISMYYVYGLLGFQILTNYFLIREDNK